VRNLYLASQVADLGLPMVIALNMHDAAERAGIEIDAALLARHLGIPVIPTVATEGRGVDDLEKAVERAVESSSAMARVPWPECVHRATHHLAAGLEKAGLAALSEGELLRVLFDQDRAVLARAGWPSDLDPVPLLTASRDILAAGGHPPVSAEALLRYEHLGHLTADAVRFPEKRRRTWTERLDTVLTHRVWGLMIFAAMMLLVFQSIYAWATPFMDLIDTGIGAVQDFVAPLLASWPALQSLVCDGVIGGAGGVLVFLPQILILFFFIALLEDTGYMARGAFLMDKIFGWCGLNGKSFVPMLSSYACAIPGILTTRTIEDPRARLTTILVSPLMSCSARLPVYTLLIGAFIAPAYGAAVAGFTLLAMHIVGLAIAIPVAWTLNRFLLHTKPQPFLLEMPPYRQPRWRDVLWRMWERAREFIVRAGTIIVAMTIIIWALVYFPRPEAIRANLEAVAPAENVEQEIAAAYIGQSYLARAGRTLQPLFEPAGFDWKITVGVLASFPAREVIIATLGTIYGIGADIDESSSDLRSVMARDTWTDGPRAGQPVFTVPVALAIMVFFALCLQCGATVAVMAKEAGWRWAVFAFAYMTALAWLGAVLTYQLGTRWLEG
jgi:ferrous iron transport protein B